MDHWFNRIRSDCELPKDAAQELDDTGFTVMTGPVVQERFAQVAAAYDAAILAAHPGDVSIGSSTTRVHDFVNRGPEFDELYVYPPVLAACCRVIGRPFKLSTMLARTLRPGSPAQALHVDFRREADGWPMVGFIIMLDEFRSDNGATRFLPRSHLWPRIPEDLTRDPTADYEGQAFACGPAGSVIVYNGSTWHGHTTNRTDQPRRSIQGAYIRREGQSSVNHVTRICPETLDRIGGLAKYLLDFQPKDGSNEDQTGDRNAGMCQSAV